MPTQSSIALTTTLTRSDELVAASLGEETVMMSLQQSNYYGLDTIGSRIWALLGQPITVADLCDQLLEVYAVEPELCRHDTLAFLQALYAEEMITIVEAPAT